MNRIVTAYQPHYYPRLHYLARAQQADVFVVYDDVQFSRGSPQHRAPIDYQEMDQLVLPVCHTGVDTTIKDAHLDVSEPWPVRHLETLIGKYGKRAKVLRPYYERLCLSLVDIESLRANASDVAASVTPSELVEDCLRWDDRRRTRKTKMDDLRERKGRLAEQIADRKRTDGDAAIADLVAAAEEVQEQLTESEAAYRRAVEQRDRHLVTLSKELGADDVDRTSMHHLWELPGIAVADVQPTVSLTELTVPLLEELFAQFDVTTQVVRSSDVPVEHPGDASEYLARLTTELGGDSYLSGGVGYENYLDERPFTDRNLAVLVQDWTPTWDDGNVCALDVLFGAENPAQYVRSEDDVRNPGSA